VAASSAPVSSSISSAVHPADRAAPARRTRAASVTSGRPRFPQAPRPFFRSSALSTHCAVRQVFKII
uniref:Uncharacterized protein LOC113792311 n=1 Tax=Dermatophagoides pteronyssinus TaxID=6956 RepID=A0A6P6XY96_DERPT